jgi:hypothetical protein
MLASFVFIPEERHIAMAINFTADDIIDSVAEIDIEKATVDELEDVREELENDDEQLGELLINLQEYRHRVTMRLDEVKHELDEREAAEADAA